VSDDEHEHIELEEGWYTDPFGLHEARWMSAGTPTKLVRDEGVESYEDPPDEEPTVTPVKVAPAPPPEGESDYDAMQQRMSEAGQFGASWGSRIALPGRLDE
jgi:hypothetical protein